jgi:hypothetical protein
MIKYIIICAMGMASINAQKLNDCHLAYVVETGDVIEIAKPSASTYKYINLPRPNFLIKRGGIVNFNKLNGQKIEISEIKTTKDCKIEVLVKRQDGKKFFNTLKTLSIDLDEAVEAGEVKLTKTI